MLCDQCEVAVINGVLCHERGCPNAWKDTVRECRWCGSGFKPEEPDQLFCCDTCSINYNT